MHAATTVGLALASHRSSTELALAAVRLDHTLDDREKSQRITAVIEAANARTVALMRQRRQLAAGRPNRLWDRDAATALLPVPDASTALLPTAMPASRRGQRAEWRTS